jgi:hypothetical protein
MLPKANAVLHGQSREQETHVWFRPQILARTVPLHWRGIPGAGGGRVGEDPL